MSNSRASTPPVAWPERASRWLRRRPLLTALCCLALLAIFVGIAVIFRRGSPAISTTSTNPAVIRLEELVSAEELFELAGQKAVVIKYFGGEVEF
jgi:hypothetical protein